MIGKHLFVSNFDVIKLVYASCSDPNGLRLSLGTGHNHLQNQTISFLHDQGYQRYIFPFSMLNLVLSLSKGTQ